jgi:hypothetical protein
MKNSNNKFESFINSLKDPKEYQSILDAWKIGIFYFKGIILKRKK